RVLTQEHVLYPLALRLVADEKARMVGDRVVVDGAADKGTRALIVPDPDDLTTNGATTGA
ncbi:MAG: hypothetical protein KDJ16_15200, partial [Hyphomicrobiales bacterium]|nr:hypothetical protein [Hyphomicrobiales bacterium]